MILDASVIAILGTPGYERWVIAVAEAAEAHVSAVSSYEAAAVLLHRRGARSVERMYTFLAESGVEVHAFGSAEAQAASEAYARYGKGIAPPGLNLGDCAVYALAAAYDMPVLATTDEFVRAGLRSAV